VIANNTAPIITSKSGTALLRGKFERLIRILLVIDYQLKAYYHLLE